MNDRGIEYYDIRKNWQRRLKPHIQDEMFRRVLEEDFHKFTYGTWEKSFGPGQYPSDFESCDWERAQCHRGRRPHHWRFVKHAACHWLVNANLTLISLAEPKRDWRIITSENHSTVWDGDRVIFDFNFYTFKIDPSECFKLAYKVEMPPGDLIPVFFAEHYSKG